MSQRHLNRMDPQPKTKPLHALIQFVIRLHTPVIIVLLTVGYAGLLALPAFERNIKFDEKALMVGAAHASARQSADAVGQGLHLAHAVHAAHYTHGSHSLQELLTAHMRALGLEVYSSTGVPQHSDILLKNGTSTSPNGTDHGVGSNCLTLHGILRSQLGDGKEALVLVTPMAVTRGAGLAWGEGGDAPAAGAPLLLAAASAAIGHVAASGWLGKDLVWLVPDVRCGGALAATRAWVRTYQAEQAQPATRRHTQFGRAGVLQQAVVVMADRVDITQLEVLVEGDDGQLPKLDMYNLLYVNSYALPGVAAQARDMLAQPWAMLRNAAGRVQEAQLRQHLEHWVAMAQFVMCQAAGHATGPHAAFKEYMVDAATARLGGKGLDGQPAPALPPPRPQGPGVLPPPLSSHLDTRAVQLAEYMEVVLRSLNNLDERFHHSYFLYLLTSPQHFVTVEVYIVPLIALIAALLLKAAAIRTHVTHMASGATATSNTINAGTASEREAAAAGEKAGQEAPALDDVGSNEREVVGDGPGPLNSTAADAPVAQQGVPPHIMVHVWGLAAATAAAFVFVSATAGWLVRGAVCPALLGPEVAQQQLFGQGGWISEQQVAELGLAKGVLLVICLSVVGVCVFQQAWAWLQQPNAAGGQELHRQAELTQAAVHVALGSLVGLLLAVMACMNWALSYAAAAMLAPLGLLPTRAHTCGRVARVACMLTLLATSPVTLLAVIACVTGLVASGPLQLMLELVLSVVCSSCATTYLFFCATYLPCWTWFAVLHCSTHSCFELARMASRHAWRTPLGHMAGMPPNSLHPDVWNPPNASEALTGALLRAGRAPSRRSAAISLVKDLEIVRADGPPLETGLPSTSCGVAQQAQHQAPSAAKAREALMVGAAASQEQLAKNIVAPFMVDAQLYASRPVEELLKGALKVAERPRPLTKELMGELHAQHAKVLTQTVEDVSLVIRQRTIEQALKVEPGPASNCVSALPLGASNEQLSKMLTHLEFVLRGGDMAAARRELYREGALKAKDKAKGKEKENEQKIDKHLAPCFYGIMLQDMRAVPRVVHLISMLSLAMFPAWDVTRTLPAFALQIEVLEKDLPSPATLVKVCSHLASHATIAAPNSASVQIKSGAIKVEAVAQKVVEEMQGKQGCCRVHVPLEEGALAAALQVLAHARTALAASKRPKELFAVPHIKGTRALMTTAADKSTAKADKSTSKGSSKKGSSGSAAPAALGTSDAASSKISGSIVDSWDPKERYEVVFYCVVSKPGVIDKSWLMMRLQPERVSQIRQALELEAERELGTPAGEARTRTRFKDALARAQLERDKDAASFKRHESKFQTAVQQALLNEVLPGAVGVDDCLDSGISSSYGSYSHTSTGWDEDTKGFEVGRRAWTRLGDVEQLGLACTPSHERSQRRTQPEWEERIRKLQALCEQVQVQDEENRKRMQQLTDLGMLLEALDLLDEGAKGNARQYDQKYGMQDDDIFADMADDFSTQFLSTMPEAEEDAHTLGTVPTEVHGTAQSAGDPDLAALLRHLGDETSSDEQQELSQGTTSSSSVQQHAYNPGRYVDGAAEAWRQDTEGSGAGHEEDDGQWTLDRPSNNSIYAPLPSTVLTQRPIGVSLAGKAHKG